MIVEAMMTIEQDTIYQYWDGRDLLKAILAERVQLLQNLEQLVKASLVSSHPEEVVGFPIVQAQTVLYKLAMIGDDIYTLVGEINRYAARTGNPRIKMRERNLQ